MIYLSEENHKGQLIIRLLVYYLMAYCALTIESSGERRRKLALKIIQQEKDICNREN